MIPGEDILSMDELEDVFCVEKATPVSDTKSDGDASGAKPGGKKQKINLLDPKKAQAIGIGLSRFKGLSLDQVAQAIRTVDPTCFDEGDIEQVRE